MLAENPRLTFYLHTERFVTDMVKALQQHKWSIKQRYRNLDALLIDDISLSQGKQGLRRSFSIRSMLWLMAANK